MRAIGTDTPQLKCNSSVSLGNYSQVADISDRFVETLLMSSTSSESLSPPQPVSPTVIDIADKAPATKPLPSV